MLPTTLPNVCVQCHMLFAPVLPRILQQFSLIFSSISFLTVQSIL